MLEGRPEMGRAGLGPANGFNPEVLRHYKDYMQDIVVNLSRTFTDQLYGQVSDDEFTETGFRSMNLMGIVPWGFSPSTSISS